MCGQRTALLGFWAFQLIIYIVGGGSYSFSYRFTTPGWSIWSNSAIEMSDGNILVASSLVY